METRCRRESWHLIMSRSRNRYRAQDVKTTSGVGGGKSRVVEGCDDRRVHIRGVYNIPRCVFSSDTKEVGSCGSNESFTIVIDGKLVEKGGEISWCGWDINVWAVRGRISDS